MLDDVVAYLDSLRERLQKAAMRPVEGARARLDLLRRSYALRAPEERLRQLRERLDALGPKLERESGRLCERARDRTGRLAQRLEALSPLAVLARGYSATFPEPDQPTAEALAPLTDASAVAPGQRLRTRLARGEIISPVEAILSTAASATEDAESAERATSEQ